MDGNKDDALKCLKIAKQASQSGNREKALKFIAKAQRLDPSLQVNDLLSQINKQNDQKPSPVADVSSSKPSDHQRRATPSTSTVSGSYTEEQVAIVRQIRKKKDYYEILGVAKSCSVDDVRKAYRKLSLKVHPDKNKAPGAEEAFKAVSKAFQCLSNEESRGKYDVSGSEEPVYERHSAGTRYRGNGFNEYYYDNEFNPDEIFRQFFFGGGMGGVQPSRQYRGFDFRAGTGPGNADNDTNGLFRILIQLLPVLLILFLNFWPSSDPVYMLSRQHPYEYKFTTQKGVNYYAKSSNSFERDYPPYSAERVGLEQHVESDFFSILSQNCRVEMQRRHWGYIHETPNCDLLRRFREEGKADLGA